MSKQTEWQARQRALGCCISCGRTAERKADGTHYAYCPDCRVKRQQQQRRGPAGARWQCRLHPGRQPVRSKLRRGEWYCGVRLMDGSRCQLASSDETPDEARARVSERDEFRTQPALPVYEWRCSRHPDATPRPANTPGTLVLRRSTVRPERVRKSVLRRVQRGGDGAGTQERVRRGLPPPARGVVLGDGRRRATDAHG